MNINPSFNNYFEIANLKEINSENKDIALKEVAKQLESLFLQMVLKSMNDCNNVMQSDLFPRENENFYQELLDQQLSLSLSKSGGIGLAEVIVRQLQGKQSLPTIVNHADFKNVKNLPNNFAENTSSEPSSVPASELRITVEPEKPAHPFIQALMPHAEFAAKSIGIDPHLLIAQSALETGWGQHMVSNNLFGIKSHQEEGVLAKTAEYIENVKTTVKDKFKTYLSYADSFNDYTQLISSKRYQNALTALTPRAYLEKLQEAGYATDPQYVDKVMSIYERIVKL